MNSVDIEPADTGKRTNLKMALMITIGSLLFSGLMCCGSCSSLLPNSQSALTPEPLRSHVPNGDDPSGFDMEYREAPTPLPTATQTSGPAA